MRLFMDDFCFIQTSSERSGSIEYVHRIQAISSSHHQCSFTLMQLLVSHHLLLLFFVKYCGLVPCCLQDKLQIVLGSWNIHIVGGTTACTCFTLLDRNWHEYLMLSCICNCLLSCLLQLLIRGNMCKVIVCIAHYLVFDLYVVEQSLLLLFAAISHLTASHGIYRQILVHVDLILC